MAVVVFSSLRCVRAQRRRAHCGLLVPLGKLVSTLLALRELALRKMNRTYGATAAHALWPCAAFCAVNWLACAAAAAKPWQGLASTSEAVPRLFEPSLRVTTDPATPSTSTARLPSSSPQSSRVLRTIHGARRAQLTNGGPGQSSSWPVLLLVARLQRPSLAQLNTQQCPCCCTVC